MADEIGELSEICFEGIMICLWKRRSAELSGHICLISPTIHIDICIQLQPHENLVVYSCALQSRRRQDWETVCRIDQRVSSKTVE